MERAGGVQAAVPAGGDQGGLYPQRMDDQLLRLRMWVSVSGLLLGGLAVLLYAVGDFGFLGLILGLLFVAGITAPAALIVMLIRDRSPAESQDGH